MKSKYFQFYEFVLNFVKIVNGQVMWRKTFKEFKRMGLGWRDRTELGGYFENDWKSRLVKDFRPLILASTSFVLLISMIPLPEQIRGVQQIDFRNDEFQFEANPKFSFAYWLLRIIDLEKVGYTWKPLTEAIEYE